MTIESLELLNFRNYEREYFQFDSETNVLFGDNAQGKTNVLEGIYLCSTTRSHRGSKDRELIRLNQMDAHFFRRKIWELYKMVRKREENLLIWSCASWISCIYLI